MCVCVRAHACVRVCVRECVCLRARVYIDLVMAYTVLYFGELRNDGHFLLCLNLTNNNIMVVSVPMYLEY